MPLVPSSLQFGGVIVNALPWGTKLNVCVRHTTSYWVTWSAWLMPAELVCWHPATGCHYWRPLCSFPLGENKFFNKLMWHCGHYLSWASPECSVTDWITSKLWIGCSSPDLVFFQTLERVLVSSGCLCSTSLFLFFHKVSELRTVVRAVPHTSGTAVHFLFPQRIFLQTYLFLKLIRSVSFENVWKNPLRK